ncbi:LysR family transcriptional regulator [Streptomyces sp. NPDC001068]|uniref:LysR family transcriptional regulator n=1 Tax=Streptomyces sp. NPDC001068 TaxID=3364544 RepID=UPI0036851FE7
MLRIYASDRHTCVELHHLRYFVAVTDEKSFTRAAQRLHVVQSAVSTAVRALERELGTTLLERTPQGVLLTEAGTTLLPLAVATLDAAREARDAVLGLHGQLQGTLRAGGVTAGGLLDIPALLGRFHTLHPDVTLRLHASPTGSAGLVRALLAGELDLAFLSLPDRRPAGLDVRELATVPMVLIVPATHRLADADSAPLSDLVDEAFIDSPAGFGNRELVDRAFSAAALDRRVLLETTDIATTTSFVRHGLGVAFLPSFMVDPVPDGLAVLTPADAAMSWSLYLATADRRRTPATVKALLRIVDTELPHFLTTAAR